MRTYISSFILLLSLSFCSAQFLGGGGDGYDTHVSIHSTSIYAGGSSDGHDSAELYNDISIYTGGNKDGYHTSSVKNTISIFSGGINDGYSLATKILSFVWTGNTGTDWNTSGNWVNGVVPSINSNVVIPPGAQNYPLLNSGLLNIGQNPNNGLFACKQLLIREGAKMTLQANMFLENYNEIEIRGILNILNQDPSSVQNLNGGLISIRNGATLIID